MHEPESADRLPDQRGGPGGRVAADARGDLAVIRLDIGEPERKRVQIGIVERIAARRPGFREAARLTSGPQAAEPLAEVGMVLAELGRDLSTALQDALTTFNAACMNLPPLG